MRGLLAALSVVAAVAQSVSQIEAGHFSGRSADVVLTKPTTSDARVIISDPSGAAVGRGEADSITATQLGDLNRRVLGVQPVGKTAPPLFKRRAKAELIVSVPSVGDETLRGFSSLRGLVAGADDQSLKLDARFFPINTISLAATVASAALPSQHGIVAGSRVKAFEPSAEIRAATAADVVSQTFSDQALVISVSSCKKQALVNGVHKPSARGVTLSLTEQGFTALGSTSELAAALELSADNIKEIVAGQLADTLGSDLPISFENDALVVRFTSKDGKSETATLSLNNEHHYRVLAELAMAQALPAAIAGTKALHRDAVPDLYSFSFASLSGLDRSSAEFSAALRLVDAATAKLVHDVRALYTGPVLSEVILLGSPIEHADTVAVLAQLDALYPTLDRDVEAAKHFPSVHLRSTATLNQQACKSVSPQLLKATGYGLHCTEPVDVQAEHHARHLLQVPAPTSLPSGNTTRAAANQVSRWQIALWLSIALGFTIVFAAYYVGPGMQFRKDTVLFSSFNPSWEDRKTR